jgi:glucokinase
MTVYGGVDLGGTNIKAVLGDSRGNVTCRDSIPTESHRGPEDILSRMAALMRRLSKKSGQSPAAVGIGVPGLIDPKAGITKFFPNFPSNWPNIPVREILEPQVGCPVYILNDVRTATLGELTFGHGQHYRDMVFVALGTGVGGGIALDGKLRLGPLGAAGELGHQTMLPDGPMCGCGNRGCLETLASGPAIAAAGIRLLRSGLAPRLHAIVAGDISKVTTETMAQAAEEGDASVRTAISDAAGFLGIGVANLVVTLHPQAIVLGGGVAQIGEPLFGIVRQTIVQRVHMLPVDDIVVLPSLLGDQAGTLGGIALAMQGGLLDD